MQYYTCSVIDQAEQYKYALENIIGSIKKSGELKSNETFRLGIRTFVNDAEQEATANKTHCITKVCQQYNIQRRRLYDVINVLEKVGVCQKTTVDTFVWLGIDNVPFHVSKLIESSCAADGSFCYSKLFSQSQHISISSLTESFILCFFAMHKPSLDIKQVAIFLSRENGRYKTTLCKLYQVTHILEAAGIIEKSMIPGELAIVPKVFRPKPQPQTVIEPMILPCQNVPSSPLSPPSIESLLN